MLLSLVIASDEINHFQQQQQLQQQCDTSFYVI